MARPLTYNGPVALGPSVPEWAALVRALVALAERTGAQNAFVTDAWGHLWCRARAPERPERVLALARTVVDRAAKPLVRGGRIDEGAFGDDGGWYARSFAGVYLVLIVFDRAIDHELVRAALIDALPAIEALTLALPSPDGPGSASGAAKMRG